MRVGLLGFGGGPSMLPLMQAECVNAGWVSDEEFLEALAVGNALPGPIATKMAVFVGWHHAGALGAASALTGIVVPTALLMLGLAGLMVRYRDKPWVAAALTGARAGVVGMLFFIAWDLSRKGVTGWATGLLAVAAFVALVLEVHPALVMVGAMVIGVVIFRT